MPITNAQLTAQTLINKAHTLGWQVFVRGDILTIHKTFTPGDNSAYCDADSEYFEVFDLLKSTRAGSVWGTTSDGVGGYSGLTGGYYTANKSGGDKRVLSALNKLLNA